MGWASGTSVMDAVISFASKYVADECARMSFYMEMISALEEQDWDCQGDCVGVDPAYDAALKALYPSWDI
jgi:hypothetical protein